VPGRLSSTTTDLNRRMSGAVRISQVRGCGSTFIGRIPDDLDRYYRDGYHTLPTS
jgi:hypothetical protein